MIDETLINNNRREHQIISHPIYGILPDYFIGTYPKIAEFLEVYYRYSHSDEAVTKDIHKIFTVGDINSLDSNFLRYLEEKLLLGQNSFKGLNDSKLALKLSHNLFITKGSQYSLEQFFRIFFGVDAEIIYTKENVFIVDDSLIGSQSFRYLINDKLYQTFAILIKTSLAVNDWIDVYKEFVHPAGLYFAGETLVVSVANVFGSVLGDCMPISIPDTEGNKLIVVSEASWTSGSAYVDATAIVVD